MMSKIKIFNILFIILILTACGRPETLDGKWVLIRQEFDDETIIKGDDLETYESYEITGDTAVFTSITDMLGEKKFDMTIEVTDDDKYQFKISDRLVFSTGYIDGKQLVFSYDDGTKFIFEKEK